MAARGAGLSAVLAAAAIAAAASTSAASALAADTLPPPPAHYFNDYAGLIGAADAQRLDAKLKAFDEQTSNQVVVAVFPELPSPSLEDFTIRTAQSWRAGREKLDNGIVLFVFVKDRKSRIEVGYGLEGALPDVTAKQILDDTMAPRFRAGDFAGGLEAAIDAIIAATRGEYKAEPPQPTAMGWFLTLLMVLLFLAVFLFVIRAAYRNRDAWATYRGSGWGGGGGGGGGGWSSGGGWGGGGGSFGGGGGFSGGGGSFGGGGASGSW
jgi:uncharacterized protein